VRLNEASGGRYMSWKRWVEVGVFVVGLGSGLPTARAEDPAPKKADAAAAPAETPKKKDPFFGTTFAMYLETRGGPASIDKVSNPLPSGPQSSSASEIGFNGSKAGQFTVGWTLPRGRGQYLLTYNGIADGDYELNATGSQKSYVVVQGQAGHNIDFFEPWWHVTVNNGQLRTTKTPPVWDAQLDDANSNGVPDPGEFRFPTTTFDGSASIPSDLGNSIQTWDLHYRREFGGIKIRSRWTAGIRYLSYKGAIVTPFWLTGQASPAGFGYSDGIQNAFMIMQQSTSGYGPVGSGEIQFNFFRQRLTLYALAQAAFLLETLHTDSGAFTYLAQDAGGFFPGSGRIEDDVSKSSWNVGGEAGVRVKMLEGFHLIVAWNRTGYLDTMLVPNSLSLPTNPTQTSQGTTARFVTRDFDITTISLGLSFQF
jgi:hypothetical protein